MSIEINNIQPQPSRDRSTGRSEGEGSRATASQRSSVVADQVQISVTANQLSGAQGESFDADRVSAIRQAIAEGTYHVDPERLASNFIELESQLVG